MKVKLYLKIFNLLNDSWDLCFHKNIINNLEKHNMVGNTSLFFLNLALIFCAKQFKELDLSSVFAETITLF